MSEEFVDVDGEVLLEYNSIDDVRNCLQPKLCCKFLFVGYITHKQIFRKIFGF